jgi:hypothetical protein
MSEPYVFQYATLDGGRKRPLRRGVIVLEMQHGNEKMKLCVHADTLAASSGVINRVFEEYVEDIASDDEESVCTIKEKACFPIPSFPPALLDEFLCNVYGKTYEHPPHVTSEQHDAYLRDSESRTKSVLTSIDMAVFFDASEPHFTRLDKNLYTIIRLPTLCVNRSQDLDIDTLMHIEPIAAKLPESWTQSLRNVVSHANNVSLTQLVLKPTETFPAEVVMHPTFKLLRDSTREKIAWALLRCQHNAWHINATRRKTATHTHITEIASEIVPQFVEGSHTFEVSGPLPISILRPRMASLPDTFIQLIIERAAATTGDGHNGRRIINMHARLSSACVCRIHADLTITYRDGTTEKIKTPRAGVGRFKRFDTKQESFHIASVTGTVRIDFCDA